MELLISFFVGVLATWIGLILAQRVGQRDKRSVVSAIIHRTLDASGRIAQANPQLGPILKTIGSDDFVHNFKEMEPKQAYDAAIVQVNDFKRFLQEEKKSAECVSDLRKALTEATAEDRERLSKLIGEYKSRLLSDAGFPKDEDLTYLSARIAPYAFEYKQRLGSLLNTLDMLSAPGFSSWPDKRLLDWFVGFMEQVMILCFLEHMLRHATEADARNRFPWI